MSLIYECIEELRGVLFVGYESKDVTLNDIRVNSLPCLINIRVTYRRPSVPLAIVVPVIDRKDRVEIS